MHWCKNCLNASTRPRIEFNSDGVCNACTWAEEKKAINWSERMSLLEKTLSKKKTNKKGIYDCIVPVSGGKDGSYITHSLIERFGIKPLCVTVRPPLALDIGRRNLDGFLNSGIDHLHVTPNVEAMRILDRIGFQKYGQGYYGWLIAIHTSVLRVAENFGIDLVIYAENGEIEYGGSTKEKYKPFYGKERMIRHFMCDTYREVMEIAKLEESERYWFSFKEDEGNGLNESLQATHFSYFENWDPYRNYLKAKEKCGLQELKTSSTGTFTNFAQNDQTLAALHYYLMYLKFGFGRATQDAGIEIRRGAMTRDQALALVKIFDNQAPTQNYEMYCDYFKMSMKSFIETLESHVNQSLFESDGNGNVKPLFEVH